MAPKLTIAIPTYNRPIGLRRAIKNVINQNFNDFELIISDNASSNKDVFLVLDWAKEFDPRISVFRHEKNLGAYENCWFLLNQAKGDYFVFLADDDFISPSFFYNIFLLEKPNEDIIYTGNLLCLESKDSEIDFDLEKAKEVTSYFEVFCGSQKKRIKEYVYSSCPLFTHLIYSVTKRETIRQAFEVVRRFYKHSVYMDTLIVYCMLVKANVLVVNSSYRIFASHPKSTGSGKKSNILLEIFDLWCRLIAILRINTYFGINYLNFNFRIFYGLFYSPVYIFGKYIKAGLKKIIEFCFRYNKKG